MVKEIILPPLSLLTDGINLQNKKIVLREAISNGGIMHPEEVFIGYGKILETFVDVMIIGFTIFLLVKIIHKLRERAQDPNDKTIETPKDIEILN